MKLIALDTESGGLDIQYSLLDINLSILNDQCEIVDRLNLKVKPDPDGFGRSSYLIQAEALRVNKIDLAQHDLEAIVYKESKTIIYRWLEEMGAKHECRFTPMGQMVQRDIDLICHYTLSYPAWTNFVERRVIDTISLGMFARDIGIFPPDQSLSLKSICKYLGIEVDEALLHTADYDVILGAKYYKWFKEHLGEIRI